MVPLAPRYDRRIVRALRSLDDPTEPIAETCRRVGEVALRLGLTRPSYVHARRLVLAERERRRTVRAVVDHVLGRLAARRHVGAYAVMADPREARVLRFAYSPPLRR
jgi:hypothetical protein